MLRMLKERGHTNPAAVIRHLEERKFTVREIIEGRYGQLNGLSIELERIKDKLWDMRLDTALHGSEPIVSKQMLNEKADYYEGEIKRVEGEIEKLKLIYDKTITNKELLEYLR